VSQVRRLSKLFTPLSYKLSITPNSKDMSFEGQVLIKGSKNGRPSKRLTLHAKDLIIKDVKINYSNRYKSKEITISRIVRHKSYDELRLHCDELLYAGDYSISISFSGKITKQMYGLYPCYYGNSKKIILATQCESHYAREIFPCVDEPEAKAVFELSLITNKDQIVLANTEIIDQHLIKDKMISIFAPTPKMSTYLLAFVIGDLKSISTITNNGVKVSAYTTKDNIGYAKFALDIASKCLDFYDNYFGIPYPLTKCDIVALPDFSSGAMENWGLITFREQAMLVDPENTSLYMKQYIANVIAHELTHQWFGNLVTMRWWNDLWLNESFASLMSYVAVDQLFPEWKVWTQFISNEQMSALKLDSLNNTHPINVQINHPDEIRTIFDNISYEKGASVLYMLMKYLGEDNFKLGLHLYLTKHSYANTESKDLWLAWEESTHKPIENFMEAWTRQAGFPIVTTKINDSSINVTQSRFYLNPKNIKTNELWPIPVFSNLFDNNLIINDSVQVLEITEKNDLPIINHNHAAFFRVVYDQQTLIRLKQSILSGDLNELDRLGILSDLFESAKAGIVKTTDCLDLLDGYIDESSVSVWEIISSNLVSIRSIISDDALRTHINSLIINLSLKQYNKLGWEISTKDSHFDQLLRPIILGLITSSDYPEAVNTAIDLFKKRINKNIHPDIKSIVYQTVARHGDSTTFDELSKMHNQSRSSEEKLNLSVALTNFKEANLINRSLNMIKSDNVKLQDVAYWVSSSFANRYAKNQTWDWLKLNWDWLEANLGADLNFYMMPRYAGRAFHDEKDIPMFVDFFKQHINPALQRPLDQAVESIEWQSAWKKRDQKALTDYLANK